MSPTTLHTRANVANEADDLVAGALGGRKDPDTAQHARPTRRLLSAQTVFCVLERVRSSGKCDRKYGNIVLESWHEVFDVDDRLDPERRPVLLLATRIQFSRITLYNKDMGHS